jgi:hypothetical protein
VSVLQKCVVLEHRAREEVRPLTASAVDVPIVGMSTNHAACGGQHDFLCFKLRDEVVDLLSFSMIVDDLMGVIRISGNQ